METVSPETLYVKGPALTSLTLNSNKTTAAIVVSSSFICLQLLILHSSCPGGRDFGS